MAFDARKNFAYSAVAVAPSPANTGTTLTVTAGDGGKFPATPFNATIWPVGILPAAGTAEIVRVTSVTGDGMVIARQQEGTTAIVVVAGMQIAQTVSNKTLADIEGALTANTTAIAGKVGTGDARLSDARTPTAHKTSHATGGSDVLLPSDIGADPAGAATGAVSTHVAAVDPHGDRAFATAGFIPLSQKGAASGVATLDSGGKLPAGQITALAVQSVWPVASQAAMLALSTAQIGDIALRSDVSENFILSALPPAALANWKTLLVPAESELIARKDQPSGYAGLDSGGLLNVAEIPALPESQITNLTSDLAAKAPIGTVPQNIRNLSAAPASVAAGDVCRCDATTGAFALPLPTPAAGIRVIAKKIDSTANAITLTGTVDGVVSPTLTVQWQSIELEGNGASWDRVVRPVMSALADWPGATDARYVGEGGAAAGTLGAAATFDFAGKRRAFKTGTLNANCVVTVANLVAGSQGWMAVTQDVSGGWTLGVSDGTTTQSVPVAGSAGGTSLVRVYSVDGVALLVEVAGGPSGPRGTKWWVGVGAPGTVAGASTGDYYINATTGEVWQSSAGTSTWLDQGFSLQGPVSTTPGPPGPAAPDASTTTKGIATLSVAPSSATAPIAVGTNDPRFNVPARMTSDSWRPTGRVETFSRLKSMTNVGALQSGRLALVGGAVLAGGTAYNTIRCFSGTTAAGTPTNQWFCLVDQAMNVLAKTVDDTTAVWAANAGKALALSATYTPVNDIAVYVGIVVVATAVPSLTGLSSANAGPLVINNDSPVLAGLSTSSLTTPASLGATAATPGAGGAMPYAQVY